MGGSAVVRGVLRVAAFTTLASALALGSGVAGAGAAGLAPAGPVPFEPFLTGVSCPATSMCMAVGMKSNLSGVAQIPLAGIWNGRTWRWMARPPEPEPDSGLAAVSCVSATRCIALGSTDASSETGGFAFGDEWNGRTWRAMPSMAGVAFADPLGLSCVTAAYCVAVGASSIFAGQPVAEWWNGTAWTAISAALPAGAAEGTLSGVSCARVSHCMAVGSYDDRTGAVAESWNGSRWTIRTARAGTLGFAGVSCPRVRVCLAVGELPAAEVWNGSTWRKLTPPDPGKFADSLTAVSCASATRCIAVGEGPRGPLAVAWTGGTRMKALAVPDQPAGTPGLDAVSCVRSTSCLAVSGNLVSTFGTWADAWNGRSWQGIRETKSDVLAAVSCPSSSDCVAAGNFLSKSDVYQSLAQSWGGKAWRLMSPRRVPGGLGSAGVSCVSRSFCMATGAGVLPRIWNGTRWKLAAAGASKDVAAPVSCATRRFCVAIGAGIPTVGLVVWNGAKWQLMNLAAPPSADQVDMSSVSCTGPKFCLAVGNYSTSDGEGPSFDLANIWNGRTWRLVPGPGPSGSSLLTSVSCLPRTGCMAVGSYFTAASTGHNLAARLNHGTWQVITMPGFYEPTGPAAVSCSLATSCVAVGGSGGELRDHLVTAQVWNGTSWQPAHPASPARLAFLDSVSCASPAFCIAAGQNDNLALTERWNGRTWKQLTENNP